MSYRSATSNGLLLSGGLCAATMGPGMVQLLSKLLRPVVQSEYGLFSGR